MKDWSEHLATMPAQLNIIVDLMNREQFIDAEAHVTKLKHDLDQVAEWVRQQRLKFVKQGQEDLVPTMKLRWDLRNPSTKEYRLQQWFADRSKPNKEGGYSEGKWIDVPVEESK